MILNFVTEICGNFDFENIVFYVLITFQKPHR